MKVSTDFKGSSALPTRVAKSPDWLKIIQGVQICQRPGGGSVSHQSSENVLSPDFSEHLPYLSIRSPPRTINPPFPFTYLSSPPAPPYLARIPPSQLYGAYPGFFMYNPSTHSKPRILFFAILHLV